MHRKPRELLRILSVAAASTLLCGCATLLQGNTDQVTLSTEPVGAYAWVDGAYAGQTPLTVRLDSRRNHSVFFRLPGHVDEPLQLDRSIRPLWVILDVLGFGLPLIVDAISRAWLQFEEVRVTLQPASSAAAPLDSETASP